MGGDAVALLRRDAERGVSQRAGWGPGSEPGTVLARLGRVSKARRAAALASLEDAELEAGGGAKRRRKGAGGGVVGGGLK